MELLPEQRLAQIRQEVQAMEVRRATAEASAAQAASRIVDLKAELLTKYGVETVEAAEQLIVQYDAKVAQLLAHAETELEKARQ